MTNKAQSKNAESRKKDNHSAVVSVILSDGSLAETVFIDKSTFLCVFKNDTWELKKNIVDGAGSYSPYSANNNLLRHRVLLLPAEPKSFGSNRELVDQIRSYIFRYADLSTDFLEIATHYVLLSWIYDSFNELPYLRFKGDYGSGKTRALLTIGSVCYKPIFASGASTVSPLFRMMDTIQGTLLIDEADFRFSDEKADIVKILNNGNAKGFPILRSEVNPKGEYDPKAFIVFGPKLIASRKAFDDHALESRCITEELGTRRLRSDIPINCPASLEEEARELRSKLLLYRFRTRSTKIDCSALDSFEPRLQQVFSPLYSVMEDKRSRDSLVADLKRKQCKMRIDRNSAVEADILEVIFKLFQQNEQVSMKEIALEFDRQYAGMYGDVVTPRWIGHIVRNRLSLDTQKSSGRYVIPRSQIPKMKWLFEKYGFLKSDNLPIED